MAAASSSTSLSSAPYFKDAPSFLATSALPLEKALELARRVEGTLSSKDPLRETARISFSTKETRAKYISKFPHTQVGDYFIKFCSPGTVLVKNLKSGQEKKVAVSFASNGGCGLEACIGIAGPTPLLATLNHFHGIRLWNLDQMMASETALAPFFENRSTYREVREVDWGENRPVYHQREQILAVAYPDHVWIADFSQDPFKQIKIAEKHVSHIDFSLTHALFLTGEGYSIYRLADWTKEASYQFPQVPYIRCGRFFDEETVIVIFDDQQNKTIVIDWRKGESPLHPYQDTFFFNPDASWNSNTDAEIPYIPIVYNRVTSWDAHKGRLFLVHEQLKRINPVWRSSGDSAPVVTRWLKDLELLEGESIKKVHFLGTFLLALTNRGLRLYNGETLESVQSHLIAQGKALVEIWGKYVTVEETNDELDMTVTLYDLASD